MIKPTGRDQQVCVLFRKCQKWSGCAQDFVVYVTEEFLEFISEGALAIEVWGHRFAGNGRSLWELDALQAKTRTLRDRWREPHLFIFLQHVCICYGMRTVCVCVSSDRWSEVSRSVEMWVSIQELNEQGEYSSVELHQNKDTSTGGVFQLRQVWYASSNQSSDLKYSSSYQISELHHILSNKHSSSNQSSELKRFLSSGSLSKTSGVC